MPKNEVIVNGSINTITRGTVINGNIQAIGDFRMDGTLDGDLTLNGKLVVGESGVITGNVICQNANVLGEIKGNVSVKEHLALYATAKVEGDILVGKLSIEPGATFTGGCRMIDEVRNEMAQQLSNQQETEKK